MTEGSKGVILYFLHKNFSKKYLLIVSMRQKWKYTNSFSAEPKHQIKPELSTLKNKFIRQNITNNYREQQKPAAIFNMYSKTPKHGADQINIKSR